MESVRTVRHRFGRGKMKIVLIILCAGILAWHLRQAVAEPIDLNLGMRVSQQKPTIDHPALFYVPESNSFIPLDSILYSESGTRYISQFKNSKARALESGIDSKSQDSRINHEDVGTNLLALSGLETKNPSWIFASNPPGASLHGLDMVRSQQTPQRIINLPEEKLQAIVAVKSGFGVCQYKSAKRTIVRESGIDWIQMICILPPP